MGVLSGVRVLEFAGAGPGPMAAMLLAELGAEVLRLDRLAKVELGTPKPAGYNLLLRSRPSIEVDLKTPDGQALALELVKKTDILIEGFRPGAMERLGLGPEDCFTHRPPLVYGRMTGWGQDGPLAGSAGHDLNYIALSGALDAIGSAGGPPVPPLVLAGDLSGALYLVMGVLGALLSAQSTGKGQVVDTAIVDASLSMMTVFFGLHAGGVFSTERGTNPLDGGDPYYAVYGCADERYLSVAPIEMRFREIFIEKLGEDMESLDRAPSTPEAKAEVRRAIADRLVQKTRDEWAQIYFASDACVAPVLSVDEAPGHPHLVARGSFINLNGIVQPVPSPRMPGMNHTPSPGYHAAPEVGLATWGLSQSRITALQEAGVVA